MSVGSTEAVTQILQKWSAGDPDAPARLMPLVYEDLRRRAAEYLRRERPDHTLQATALGKSGLPSSVSNSRSGGLWPSHY